MVSLSLRMEADLEEVISDARCKIYCRETSNLTRISYRGLPSKLGETSQEFTYIYELFGEKNRDYISTNVYHYHAQNGNSATVVWNIQSGIGHHWREFLIGYRPGDLKSRDDVIDKLKELIQNVEWSEVRER